MKLFNIAFKNYRNFEDYNISLGRKVTVFIGRNGMGKTNIIEGMVQSLSFIFSKQRDTQQYEFIRSTDQGVKSFKSTDPLYVNGNYTYPLSIDVNAGIISGNNFKPLAWSFEQESKKSGLKDSKFRGAYHSFWNHYNPLAEKPVLAFFSDGFPHKDTNISFGMKDKLKSGNPLPPGDGYYQWDKEQSCVNIWKKYFVQQWMNNRLNPDSDKAAFVDAVNYKLHEFSLPINSSSSTVENVVKELSVDFRDDEATLLISFVNGVVTPFDTLPAGYERLYSIVLDLASRSYLLNKNTDPEGIVFIDEIDLHLHPSLEAEVLPRLQRSFPHIQFIVSTHSPIVISNFDQNDGSPDDYRLINLLRDDEGYYNKTIADIFGLDYNSSLVNIMEVSSNEKYKEELIRAYMYWRENDEDRANQIAEMLREKYGSTSDIIRSLNL